MTFIVEIGGRKTTSRSTNHNKSSSGGKKMDQQVVEKVPDQMTPDIREPPNEIKEDTQLKTAGIGLEDSAIALESVTNDAKGSKCLSSKPVDQDQLDLTMEFQQIIRDETKEEDAKTNDQGMAKKTEVETALPAKSDLVLQKKKLKIEPNYKTDQWTAIVFIAAPQVKNHDLAIVGEDQHLGKWKQPKGEFESIVQIGTDLYIFKGIVPVPDKPNFKFVHVNVADDKIEYEGEGIWDNRTEELLPDSWNFFVFKPKPKSVFGKAWEAVKAYLHKSETKEKIAFNFFRIVFDHTLETILPDWDSAMEFISECLAKVKQATGAQSSEGFLQFLNKWFEDPEIQVNFDQLFLLIVGACKMEVYSTKMKQILEPNRKEFSRYLHKFGGVKRKGQDLKIILERIACYAGPDFWWILFRLNRHLDALRKFTREEVSESIFKTLQEIPEVLLDIPDSRNRVVDHLVRWNDIDEIYFHLFPVFEKNVSYQQILQSLLLQRLFVHKTSVEDVVKILRSEFMEKAFRNISVPSRGITETENNISNDMVLLKSANLAQTANSKSVCEPSRVNRSLSQEGLLFEEAIRTVFNRKLSDAAKVACCIPNYMLPIVTPIVESMVSQTLDTHSKFNREDYRYFGQLDENCFKSFPRVKEKISAILLKMTVDHVKSGSFQDIPTLKLMLLGLAEKKDIPFLERAKVVDLQKAIGRLPRKFFNNLYATVKKSGTSVEKTLKVYRKGATKAIVEQLENHFDQLEDILNRVRDRRVPLIELASLQDPQVLDCLKSFGFSDRTQDELRQEIEELRERHNLYGSLYSRFSRSEVMFTSQEGTNEEENDLKEDDSEEDDNKENDNEENVSKPETRHILDPKEWESYLKDVDSGRSILTLKDAMNLQVPLQLPSARWLFRIKESDLFMEKIWHPMVKSSRTLPLCRNDLQAFVIECAAQWEGLARRIADGSTSFIYMDEIVKLQSDSNVLSKRHLQMQSVEGVETAYRNFKNLQELRHLIGPFVAALRFFTIHERGPIDALHNFIKTNLLKNWDTTTLAQIAETGILKVVNEELNIDPERPETRNVMQFISSLVTDENRSPLIEWLRQKTEKDMEAMGKILQGTLLVAYGQLQTLRTRIAPFLQNEFRTYQDLLKVVRDSEERFAQRVSGRVQPIDCKWLVNMLPEIQAAVRASVISPSEDAKEKLTKLHQIVIDPKNEFYSIEIRLKPSGLLSMEELKQAFQLLDMAAVDDGDDNGELIDRIRRNVGLIEKLSEVFRHLYASGCITFTFRNSITIGLADLETEIKVMQDQLEKWTDHWKEIEEMPFLSLFSRGYLLQLADLIGKNEIDDVKSILKIRLPAGASNIDALVNELIQQTPSIDGEEDWLSVAQLFTILRQLHQLIKAVFHQKSRELDLPPFLVSYGRTLRSHFIDKAVVILNVPRELLVGSSLAAFISLTNQPIEPSRILFVTTNTDKPEVERFMKLWSVGKAEADFFIILHVERLTAACACAVREGVDRVLPERRAKLLLLAQHHHRVQSTKSLGARLGVVSDRLLEVNFTADQLRQCFASLLPNAANLHFFTSKLPGCGKSQQAMQKAANQLSSPDYYRICVRTGSVDELLASLKKIETLSSQSRKSATYLHLDVAHSVSFEFNDILLSLLVHGALFDPKKAKLGYWVISPRTSIALEFASPFGVDEFPVIAYLGKHYVCECNKFFFSYDLAAMPRVLGQPVMINRSNALVAIGKFLQVKQAGQKGLRMWDDICSLPEILMIDPLPEDTTFDLLVDSFQHEENRTTPTFSALNAMASFLYRHICAMITSMWFNGSAVYLFERDDLAGVFKLNVFDLLLKVANDSINRCWSLTNQGKKLTDMDWTNRQRAMFLLGLNENGFITGMNVVGRDANALKSMFHASLLPILQHQCLHFQELRGFRNLMESREGAEVILNAMRSLLLLDGTATSAVKVYQLDSHPKNTAASQRLNELVGQDQGYVLTGDNITKMMFALYRIRCGLPVVAFGEAGVGKSALFRFLIQTLLNHTFEVCNVNSGTSIEDVEAIIDLSVKIIARNPEAQVFLFFDEMNTADPPVIAFFKELMLDRHCHGTLLPENLHLMAAANPYRHLHEADKEAAVGLAFRFTQSESSGARSDARDLVYRVNELPVAFYDHIYDFGRLCDEAENTYIEEICQHGLPRPSYHSDWVKWFVSVVQKSHSVARALSVDPESAVSLRDAARAVQLFHWFCLAPAGQKISQGDMAVAADLTIYLVYAFRFRKRKMFLRQVFGNDQSASENMTEVSRFIAEMLYEQAHGASIGSGAIALNDALCENLFALYVCVLNGIFLIIVGRPGSSKSLSVEILKLVLSPGNYTLRQKLGDLPAITELYFQCSPMSTSSGFKALFESAQRLSVDPKTMLAMVVLDELGLADMSPEKPIKVLHSELERQSVLTSGEKQQSPYSVVALSNWVVDAAQVNRGILILRAQANKEDLLRSAKQLADSLLVKYAEKSARKRILEMLTESLESVVSTYQELDKREDIGGGHFFSMRDFFFCVKNFVCSVFDSYTRMGGLRDIRISRHLLIQSAVRNFGGHEKARRLVRNSMANNLEMKLEVIPVTSPLDLIVANIQDSSKPLSIHIARHLMILNRSMIGLQLLNRYVKRELDDGTNWNVLFGSCFPGDLQVAAVTRKLRQVEQAIRSGGVLILCHADQLFESLYMVLNQQYWAQGEVTMTQIALGPSIRAIALPNGPFRIIALQDTDVALNRELMSPAILSRFEKHELRPSHLLDDVGKSYRDVIESHPLWFPVAETIKRQKFIYGYHEESFAALALYLQDGGIPMELEETQDENQHSATTIWMRATNPMSMIKLERDPSIDTELLDECRHYRHNFVLENIDEALHKVKSNRIVLMTNTLRHLEIAFAVSSPYRHSTIQLFEILTELELVKLLESINDEDLADPYFCLIVQYDAVTGPIEQFQLAKYEIEQRFEKKKCRVIFVVHVDPRPVNMHWVFSFGDGWDYCFVDEVVRGGQLDHHRIPLGEFVKSASDQTLSGFIEKMSTGSFKSLLLEMLGPVLQTSLATLRASLGQFYSGVRIALGLPNNQTLIKLMKECLLAQLNDSGITWNVVDAVNDPSFDSSSSLTEGLWGVFKHKICNPLAHFLLVSDIWRISDRPSVTLWCDFVTANYPDRLMSLNSSDSPPQIPVGFRTCTQPFGRLLASFGMNYGQRTEPRLNEPLQWLLKRVAENEDENSEEIKEAYFLDWFLLRIPPHLHRCLRKVPLSKMSYLIDSLFEEQAMFFLDWEHCEAEVIAALELVSIACFATADTIDFWSEATSRIRNWKFFTETAARLSLETLASADVMKSHKRFMQSISSIELSPALTNLLDRGEDLPRVWLGLRITKRILLFDPDSDIRLPELQVSTPQRLFDSLTDLVITSVVRPRMASGGQTNRIVRTADLNALLKSTSSCSSPEELAKILAECPTTNSIVLHEDKIAQGDIDRHCPSCESRLTTIGKTEDDETHPVTHLRTPSAKVINSLFEDYQKFMFFFERVAELFIQQRKNNPRDIQDLLHYVLSSDFRLRVSWRFLTVIVRSVLSTRSGKKIMDDLLLTIRCNRPSVELNVNAYNVLRALLACADQDIRNNQDAEPGFDLIEAAMADNWTVDRIQRLANIRKQIAEVENGMENVIAEWSGWRKNQNDQALTDSLLFFILRFFSSEGDQIRLSRMFRNPRIAEELNHHKVVNDFIMILSPLSLGFDLQSATSRTTEFQKLLLDGDRFDTEEFQHYRALREIQPDWAPFIARLAYHAHDIFVTKHIRLLREMATNLVATSQCVLPGIDNHPYLASFTSEAFRWFVCNCGTLNCVGNCGHPTPESICVNCRVALSQASHHPRAGVRRATARDFEPPTGIHVTRNATRTPTFAVRNCSPVVTRFALLLNSLALMNAALNRQTDQRDIIRLFETLPLTERQQVENRQSLIRLLSNHIIVHLDLLCQLLVASRPQLAMTDKFRIGHLLLHKLLASQDRSFLTQAADFANGTQARETFENGLTRLLNQQVNLAEELDHIAGQSDAASKVLRQSFLHNETSHWAYARRVFADRQTLQLELARNGQLRKTLPFLNFLLDDENWMPKLNALQYLGEALRFVALVRTVLAGEITLEEANRMTIAQGLEKITDIVMQKVVLLDRGRPVSKREHVMDLFDGFKQLWDRFSQLQNAEKKTFLDYFECQQVDVNVRPKTILDQEAPLILILAGNELPETTFSCQLLSHAVEAASSIALTDFIQPLCRGGSGRVRLSCSSSAALTDFDESLYAHVSTEEVDNFIRDHVIDRSTLQLAESFAMAAILGPAGSTIAEELSLEVIPEFVFKDDMESGNFLVSLERRSIPWQPSAIPPQLQEIILADLEKNRSLAEARSILISVITHLHSNTEPLVVSKVRKNYISDVLEELVQAEVLTERHISNATVGVLNRHLKLEVRHAFGLLKAIVARMKGDDVFGGRVREGWTTMMPERLAQLTSQKLRADAQPGGILETVLQMVNIISGSQPVPVELTPDKSLLYAIRQIEGPEWDGIPTELKMEHLGHLLLIVESVAKK